MNQSEEEAPRPVADVALEHLLEHHVKSVVVPAVYAQLIDRVNDVAKVHYGRGYKQGASDTL